MSLRKLISPNFKKLKHISQSAFSRKSLFVTNIAISVSLSAVGDVIEQKLEIVQGELDKWNRKRTINMSISGLTVGIICHNWYYFLDRILPGRAIKVVIKKVVVDQVICSPICISAFFLTLGYLENKSVPETVNEIQRKAWKLYAAEWIIWPPAQVVNFWILPTKYRVLYDNVISLGYDIYTSRIKHLD